MNYIQLVGHVVGKPTEVEVKTNSKYSKLEVKVASNFRESDGSFREDVFEVYLWQGAHRSISEHLKENDMIACKGRLELINKQLIIISESCEILRP